MKKTNAQRGYVMVIVLLVIAVLLTAGLYGIRALESDLRASTYMRRSEILARAAEAGAAHRAAEISLSTDDCASSLNTNIAWTVWPPDSGSGGFPTDYEVDRLTRYNVTSEIVARVNRPPAGERIDSGGRMIIHNVTSYAIAADPASTGEHAVSMGVRVWCRGDYNN